MKTVCQEAATNSLRAGVLSTKDHTLEVNNGILFLR